MTNPRVRILSFALLAAMAGLATPSHAAVKVCPQIYQPVCAVTPAGPRETYANACMALRAHARMLHSGRCVGPFCFFIFSPVCARNPATHKPQTYSNLCASENANATLIHDGPCK